MRIALHGSAVTATAVSVALLLGGCGQTGGPAGSPHAASETGGFLIGVLMPDNNVTRYQAFDKPYIEKKVKELCGACTVEYANAQGDVSTQRQQLNTMLINGARALILDPVDAKAMRRSVQQARGAGVQVVSYDRLVEGPVSGYDSYDDYAIGRIQAQALLRGMQGKRDRRIVWLDTPDFYVAKALPIRPAGAMAVLKGRVKIGKRYVIAVPNVQDAYTAMSAAIAALGPHRIDGVYTADDVMAAGAISALKAAHVTPLPPVVGQDAELSALQRVVMDEQYMTLYKPYGPEAGAAAEMAVALSRGRKVAGIAKTTVGNATTRNIPALLLTPVPVTAESVKSTVVKDGVYTIKQICTAKLVAACKKIGLTS